MNQYGLMAQRHWERWLPGRYATITDPDSYFSALGEEAASQIADLAPQLAGSDPPGETYLVKAGRLNMARLQAEEIVLADLLPPPETETSQEPQSSTVPGAGPDSAEDLVIRPGHPRWEQVNAEQQDLASG